MKPLLCKKMLVLALAGSLAYATSLPAQIVFEQAFSYSGNITQLEKAGTVFYLMDVSASECRIYNVNYSLYKTIKLDVPANRYLYDIQFISQNLFDTDDGIELLYVYYQYVQTANSYYYIYTTRIADENGAVLLDVPGGSWSDIRNIGSVDSRMLIWVTDYSVYPYPVDTRVYRLPGQLSGAESIAAPEAFEGRIFPNPTTGPVSIKAPGFGAFDPADWVIMDTNGKLIARLPITDPGKPVDLKSLGLVSGTYLVRMESKNYQTKFQQVVLNN